MCIRDRWKNAGKSSSYEEKEKIMAKIEIKNVYKIFGENPSKILPMVQEGATKEEILEQTGHTVGLDNVSINVEEGETFVCMGLSGSGKSTLIETLSSPTVWPVFSKTSSFVAPSWTIGRILDGFSPKILYTFFISILDIIFSFSSYDELFPAFFHHMIV